MRRCALKGSLFNATQNQLSSATYLSCSPDTLVRKTILDCSIHTNPFLDQVFKYWLFDLMSAPMLQKGIVEEYESFRFLYTQRLSVDFIAPVALRKALMSIQQSATWPLLLK